MQANEHSFFFQSVWLFFKCAIVCMWQTWKLCRHTHSQRAKDIYAICTALNHHKLYIFRANTDWFCGNQSSDMQNNNENIRDQKVAWKWKFMRTETITTYNLLFQSEKQIYGENQSRKKRIIYTTWEKADQKKILLIAPLIFFILSTSVNLNLS